MKLESPLVTTAWLAEHLKDETLRIYDTTLHLRPNPDGFGYKPESGRAEWERAHIPGAEFLDVIGELSDNSQSVPLMMPPADEFAAIMVAHGVSDDSTVVLYNNGVPMWSTRVWWMLRSVGFDNVAVLDGGLQKWVQEGRPLTDQTPNHPKGSLSVSPRPEMWADKDDMLSMVETGSPVTINALSPEVYSGEKNQYGRAGHIPNTHNVYYGSLLDPGTGEFLPAETLRPLFSASGALDAKRVVTYCGGGISATMDCLALYLCGQRSVGVYDGSMSEWVRDEALPLTLGDKP